MNGTRLAILVAALLLIAGGILYREPISLASLVVTGHSPVCPLREALQSRRNARLQIAIKDRILQASREVERDPKGFHLWDTPKGRYWVPAGSDYTLPYNLAEQERKIYGTAERAVRQGDTVLDCGANVGVYVREALHAGARLVVAIEPAPENLECLRRNFPSEIAAGRVRVYPKGVWDQDTELTINIDPHNSAADSFVMRPPGAQAVMKLPLTTIDKLVAELGLERVDYIKMDIEGAEQHALAGGRVTLARFRPRLAISAYHLPEDPVKIPALIHSIAPAYQMECGCCAEADGHIRPDVLFFR